VAYGPKCRRRGSGKLFELDKSLRDEADRVLTASGLGEIVRTEHFQPVGSYVMHTMTWRDLDFERGQAPPDCRRHWELGARLAELPLAWKLHCADAYRQPYTAICGLYRGLRLSDPTGSPVWKVDLWTARPEELAQVSPNCA
jgi:hypothetical protein